MKGNRTLGRIGSEQLMNEETKRRIDSTVRRIVELLVAGEYDAIEALTDGVRLKRGEIEREILEYGRKLTAAPDAAYSLVDTVTINGTSPSQYSIRFRLYTEEEGQSDLEIQATLIDKRDSLLMNVEIDNILVA